VLAYLQVTGRRSDGWNVRARGRWREYNSVIITAAVVISRSGSSTAADAAAAAAAATMQR